MAGGGTAARPGVGRGVSQAGGGIQFSVLKGQEQDQNGYLTLPCPGFIGLSPGSQNLSHPSSHRGKLYHKKIPGTGIPGVSLLSFSDSSTEHCKHSVGTKLANNEFLL